MRGGAKCVAEHTLPVLEVSPVAWPVVVFMVIEMVQIEATVRKTDGQAERARDQGIDGSRNRHMHMVVQHRIIPKVDDESDRKQNQTCRPCEDGELREHGCGPHEPQGVHGEIWQIELLTSGHSDYIAPSAFLSFRLPAIRYRIHDKTA
jgi:hypothetical protein